MATPTKPHERTSEASSLNETGSTPSTKAHKDMPDTHQARQIEPPKSVEEWAKSIISTKSDEIGSPQTTINLSRFGLKNARDVVAFLESPAGEITLGEIGAEIAHQDTIKEQQRFAIQEHNLLMHRIRALLFLWFIEEKSHAAAELRDLVVKQNTKTAKDEAKLHSNPSSESSAQLNEALADYDRTMKAIQKNLEKNSDQLAKFDEILSNLKTQGQEIEEKYNEYENELLSLENSIPSHANLSEPEIEDQLKVIENEANQIVDQITESLESNDDQKANNLKNKLSALNIKAAVLFDMRAVHKSEKYYADAEGNKVTSFKDAHFILNKGKTEEQSEKLVKADNQLYLLKPGQTWDSVKDNQQAKEEASTHYEQSKQQFMSVKKVVHHHKNFEQTVQKAQVSETEQRREHCRGERELLKNQMNLVQSARASAEQALKQPNLGQEPSRPTPTAGHATSPKPSQASATLFYREQIKLLKQSSDITEKALYDLANQAPRVIRKEATEFLKQEFTKLSQRGAIPQTTMQNLLQRLERFGVSPKLNKSVEEQTYQSPSPFSTKPNTS